MAWQPVDIAIVRIDRIDLARIVVLAQHCQEAPRDLVLVARRADQRDAFGRKEAVEGMRHAGMALFLLSVVRHCEERSEAAIHIFRGDRWIASRSLSSGAHSRGPLARNEE